MSEPTAHPHVTHTAQILDSSQWVALCSACDWDTIATDRQTAHRAGIGHEGDARFGRLR